MIQFLRLTTTVLGMRTQQAGHSAPGARLPGTEVSIPRRAVGAAHHAVRMSRVVIYGREHRHRGPGYHSRGIAYGAVGGAV